MATLGDVLARQARRVPDREALVFGERRIGYAQLGGAVNRRARALQRLGLRKGARLALMRINSAEFVYTAYAASRLGLILVPVNPRMAAPEVAYLLSDSGASAFVYAAAEPVFCRQAMKAIA